MFENGFQKRGIRAISAGIVSAKTLSSDEAVNVIRLSRTVIINNLTEQKTGG